MRNLLEYPITDAERQDALEQAIQHFLDQGLIGDVRAAALREVQRIAACDAKTRDVLRDLANEARSACDALGAYVDGHLPDCMLAKSDWDRALFTAAEIECTCAREERASNEIARLRAMLAGAETMQRALAPFAAVADEYDDGDDDAFEVWVDAGPEKMIRASFVLENYRRARAAMKAWLAGSVQP